MREVQLEHVLDARIPPDLLVRGVPNVEQHRLSGLDLERRLDRVVPRVLVRVAAEIVERAGRGGGRHLVAPEPIFPAGARSTRKLGCARLFAGGVRVGYRGVFGAAFWGR